uniref:LRRCT domain-containing protein n=1 Tax=Anopheles funestus TaxID=62324 RepID=A0A182S3J9_ANOFN
MENLLKLLLFAILLVSRGNCGSIDHVNQTTVLLSMSGEMDQSFFARATGNNTSLLVWHSDSRELELTTNNSLESLSVMEAPKLDKVVLYPNMQLKHLILRFCLLDGLAMSLYNLRALRMLKLEICRINGTFNLAELLPLGNLTTFSLEGNKLQEIVHQPDESVEETEPSSALRILDLSSNIIEYFYLDVLWAFPVLNELVLRRNKLVTFAGSILLQKLGMLSVSYNLLTELDLSGCNCSSLLNVNVEYNRLHTFPVFGDSISGIEALNLNNNQLRAFNTVELRKQQHLKTLIMSNNVLKSFHDENGNETTVELPDLEFLELLNNPIESLDLGGWLLPTLKTLRVMNNSLVMIPDDLWQRYPQLANMFCFCPNIPCEWIQRHVDHIRSGRIEMSVAREGPMQVGKGYRCVTIPYVGCVRCPFRRKEDETKNSAH